MNEVRNTKPPKWSLKLLRFFLRPSYIEEIEGDMEEVFNDYLEQHSVRRARLRYNLELLKLLRPQLVKKMFNTQKFEIMTTFVHSYRKFRRKPVFSILNTLGLALGIFSVIIILTYLYNESEVDQFHSKSHRIVRLNKHVLNLDGSIENHPLTSGPMAQAIKDDYPGVENTVRVLPWFNDEVLIHGETAIKSKKLLFVDKSFFEVFDFDLVQGDENSALESNRSIILSEAMAKALIGQEDPLDQIVKGFKGNDFIVSGVIKDRIDSHIQYDAIIPMDAITEAGINWLGRWFPQMVYTYVLFEDMDYASGIEADLGNFMHKYFPQREEAYKLYFQTFDDIYTRSTDLLYNDKMRSGSHSSNQILSVVAIVILSLVIINFLNLSSIGKAVHAKGLAIKSLVGANSMHIHVQFMAEAFMKFLVATILAAVGIYLVWSQLEIFIPQLQLTDVLNPWVLMAMIASIILVPVLTGIYLTYNHKLTLTAAGPTSLGKKSSPALRNGLIVFQFFLSSAIITTTFFNLQQLRFIDQFDLGYEPESILSLRLDGPNVSQQATSFKNELLAHPDIESITLSRNVPGLGIGTYNIQPEGIPSDQDVVAAVFMMGDFDFQEVYNLEILEGRFFSEEMTTDRTGVVINEKLRNDLGWEAPIGKKLEIPGEFEGGQVIGVVKDFHIKSLRTPIEPMAMIVTNRQTKMSIKLSGEDRTQAIEFVEKTWQEFEPNYPMEVLSLDQVTSGMYEKEQTFSYVLTFFSLLAIVIASLGQIGLMYFITSSRLKELSIRKVLGANMMSIMKTLSWRMQTLILAGFLLSIPLSFYIVSQQLENYAYSITMGVVPFLVLGFAIMLLALALSLSQTYRASRANPASILRSE